jgi:hypothetical protein
MLPAAVKGEVRAFPEGLPARTRKALSRRASTRRHGLPLQVGSVATPLSPLAGEPRSRLFKLEQSGAKRESLVPSKGSEVVKLSVQMATSRKLRFAMELDRLLCLSPSLDLADGRGTVDVATSPLAKEPDTRSHSNS